MFRTANDVMAALEHRPAGHLIGGELARSDRSFDVINPATGAPCARCPEASREQLDAAVAHARAAQLAWAAKTPLERRAALLQLAAVLRANAEELAALVTCVLVLVRFSTSYRPAINSNACAAGCARLRAALGNACKASIQ